MVLREAISCLIVVEMKKVLLKFQIFLGSWKVLNLQEDFDCKRMRAANSTKEVFEKTPSELTRRAMKTEC